jgi:hypothetical protein
MENLNKNGNKVGPIHIEEHDDDSVKIFGVVYYKESYVKEMMSREYYRGLQEGRQIHIAQIEKCSNCLTT